MGKLKKESPRVINTKLNYFPGNWVMWYTKFSELGIHRNTTIRNRVELTGFIRLTNAHQCYRAQEILHQKCSCQKDPFDLPTYLRNIHVKNFSEYR